MNKSHKFSFQVIFLLLVLLINSDRLLAQERYEKEINELATNLYTELNSIVQSYISPGFKTSRVAIISLENEDGKTTKLTEWISDEISVELIQQAKGAYVLLDRDNIQKIMKEKNIPKDYGNKKDFARKLGRFKAADLVIVGKVINFENNYRVIFTVIETKEGNTVSGARGQITKTDLLKSKNEESTGSNLVSNTESVEKQTKNQEINKATNEPEIDKDCDEQNMGNLTLENKLKYSVDVSVFTNTSGTFNNSKTIAVVNLAPGERKTQYGLNAANYSYSVYTVGNWAAYVMGGTVQVRKCKNNKMVVRL